MPAARMLVSGMSVLPLLAACGGSGGSGNSPAPPPDVAVPPFPPPTAVEGWHGRFFGEVTVDGQIRIADALLTEDGLVRIYIGGPGPSSGLVQPTRPDGALQYIGDFSFQDGTVSSHGQIQGEDCASDGNAPFCSEIAAATFVLADLPRSTNWAGELRVETGAGVDTWAIELDPWKNYYLTPAQLTRIEGTYTESLAEFVGDGSAVLRIDATGQLFFQSAQSGCVGNGTLTPHLDGDFNVYDVTIDIASCNAPYDRLNGGFEGLATTSPTDFWGYDLALRTWLSKTAASPAPAAVTTWAPYNY